MSSEESLVRPLAHLLIEILSLIVIIIGAVLMGTAPSNRTIDYLPIVVVFAVICLLNIALYSFIEGQTRYHCQNKWQTSDI